MMSHEISERGVMGSDALHHSNTHQQAQFSLQGSQPHRDRSKPSTSQQLHISQQQQLFIQQKQQF
jgi:hypothetical protein